MPQSFYIFLANLTVVVHVGYVAFVVLGLVAIITGAVFRWKWVRNPLFRYLHLLAIVIVAAETAIGMTCPLTTWENHFRVLGGQETIEGDFIANFFRGIIFPSYLRLPITHWIFKLMYFGFAALILATLFLIPPRGLIWVYRRFRLRS